MRLGIVIPALDEVKRLPFVLECLGRQLRSDDLVVVADNGSSDGTPDLVEDMASTCSWLALRYEARPGPGWARRTGTAHVLARWSDDWDDAWIIACDADTMPTPDHLEVWRRHLEHATADVVTGGYRLDPSEGAAVVAAQPLFEHFTRCVAFCEQHVGVVNPAGPNHAVRPAAYLRVGGYTQPTSTRVAERASIVPGDDWDLGVRARLAGLSVQRVDHKIAASARRFLNDPGGYLAGTLHDGAFHRVEHRGPAGVRMDLDSLRLPTAARAILHFLLKPLLVGIGGMSSAQDVARFLEPELGEALVSSVGAGRQMWVEDRDSFIYDLLRSQEPLARAVAADLFGSQFAAGTHLVGIPGGGRP